MMTLTITFALGTDLDNAQVQVQNRVSQALPRLPAEVQRIGVTTEKASPDLMMVVHVFSPDARYDMLYLSNFVHLQVRDEIARIEKIMEDSGAHIVRTSRDEAERLKFWAGRKSAFPAVGRLAPDYYCMDGTIPRSKLGEVLNFIAAMERKYGLRCPNVFHAGDGNLHPLIL
ncbi:MAG: efflux RND transporter permease subunit, partial [Gammaproteobacteria bacterium]